MSVFKRITAVLCMAAVAGTSLLSFSSFVNTADINETVYAAVDDNNDDWIHAKGSRLYDMNGNEVWITGANWFGFNCGERFPHGLWSADIDQLLTAISDRGINTLRLPIATELLLDWMDDVDDSAMIAINPKNTDGYKFNPDFCRSDGSCMSSHEIFDVILKKCKKYGIKVFIDIHSPALHNSGHNYNLWYYNEGAGSYDSMAVTKEGTGVPVTSKMWEDSLVWLADQYKNDDTLIAYDLKNEPHGKCPEGSAGAKWDGSTDENNWAYASTKCALAMLEKNPNALILIEGVEQYPRENHKWGDPDSKTDPPAYGGWWGGQFRGVRDYPINLGKYQDKLMYSPHDYGPGVYAQTWFEGDFTEESLLKDYWYDTWAFINKEEIAPLLIGEWGGFMDGGKNEQWLVLLREYMIKNHINHTFWCLNPNSGDTGGLLDYSFANWDQEKYDLFEPSLWQTAKTGKYIGLDHQTALGSNGLSLNEFYSSYAAGEGSNLDGGKTSSGTPVDAQPAVTEAKPETTKAPETTTAKPETTKAPETTTAQPETTKAPEVTTAKPETTKVSETTAAKPETTKAPVNNEILYGDVDGSGIVDITDISVLAIALVDRKELTGDQKVRADVTGNGKVELADLASIKQYVSKVIDHLGPKK